jgi:flagellar biosynthesis chaperone FliJ
MHNLKVIAAALDLKISSLRVYIAYGYFPCQKLGNRVFVTNEVLENLKWLKEQGLPISQYYAMRGKPFKDEYPRKEPTMHFTMNSEGQLTNERWLKEQEIKQRGSSGLGDNGSDRTTDVYDVPKELIIWGEDQTTMSIPNLRKKVKSLLDELQLYEDALREKDKGYTGRTIVASAPGLVNELQQTIAEQEKELEKKDKELKKQENYYLGKLSALVDKLPYPTMSKEERERADNIETITAEMLDEAVRSLNKLK